MRVLFVCLFFYVGTVSYAQSLKKLNKSAIALYNQGEYTEAAHFAEIALKKVEIKFGKRHENYIVSLDNLATIYVDMGQYDKSIPLYLEAVANTNVALGKNHPDYVMRLNKLAELYNDIGQYDEALPLYIEVLEIREKSLGKKHPGYSSALNNLAGLYYDMGQYDLALSLYMEALQIVEESLGKNHPEYGTILNNLAGLYRAMGRHDKAHPLYLEAVENIEKNRGKLHIEYGFILNNLGGYYLQLGQYDKALPLYLEVLEIIEKSFGKDHRFYGTILNNLALLYRQTGNYDKAIPMFMESLSNIEKNLGKDHPSYGTGISNLAGLYESIGEYDNALPLFIEALDVAERLLGKKHSEYGVRLNSLAYLYNKIDQYDKALPMALEALEIIENSLGKEHDYFLSALNNLVESYQAMNHYELALPIIVAALDNIFGQLGLDFSYRSETEKEQSKQPADFLFSEYQSFFTRYFADKPEVTAHAFDIELATKGMILQSGIHMRQAILSSGDTAALQKFDDWSVLKSILSQQYSKPIAKRRADLKEVEAQAEKLEAELTRLSSTFGNAQKIGSTRWQDIQEKLKEHEVAIEFASFQYRNDKEWTDSTLYIALVLRKGDEHPHLVMLCEQAQLDSLFARKGGSDAAFVSSLYRGLEPVFESATATYGQRLYELVWQPLEKYLQPGDKVYFAPSGSLHQLAFAAIPIGNDSLLSDRYQLQQLSTTAKLLESPKFSEPVPTGIALYGGIQYDVEPEVLLAQAPVQPGHGTLSRSLPAELERGESWSYLPGTLTEVQAIEQLAGRKKISTSTYAATLATEAQYKSQYGNNSPRVLHIATHGFFFPDPEKQYTDRNPFLEERQVFKSSDNPLNRSGILFAGANHAWKGKTLPENTEDGILTAYEAANTILSNTQLVVLSACETGLGDIKGSEGVFGLQRAFKAAGAEYLLMSLWKVPDKETAEFMTYFYDTWFSGTTIPDAFRKTQQYMKAKYPGDPYKWAAFVLVR